MKSSRRRLLPYPPVPRTRPAMIGPAGMGGGWEIAIFGDLTEKRGRTMNAHSHLGAFGLLALVLAFIQPALSLTDQRKRQFAVMFLLGALILRGLRLDHAEHARIRAAIDARGSDRGDSL